MHYTGPIFRPPVEAMLNTKLLQVTVGCAPKQDSMKFVQDMFDLPDNIRHF